jgi:hypothetical protein
MGGHNQWSMEIRSYGVAAVGVEWNAPARRVIEVGFDSEGILSASVGGFDTPNDLIYLIPGTRHFKTAGSNLSVNGFTWEPDRTVLTAPVAPRVSDYTNSQLAVLDGDRVRVFGPSDDLQVGNITAIYGRGSEIWIGGEFGLEQFDQGRFDKIAAVDDQWLRGISGIVETANGDLWLNAISGIFHIRKAEISEALKDPAYRVKGEHFGRREGFPGIANQLRPLPTAIEGTDGRLWFASRYGVVWLDPAAYSEKRTVLPPITSQSVSVDDKGYAPDSRLSLPAHTSSVQISYNAVSLSDPEAIRFRYKLQETDKDWHETAAATPVTYRNLPPGPYHFSVEASDTNGTWSSSPANVAFTILPTFYQTNWFRLLCIAAFLAFFCGLYQLRVQQLRGEERKLREAIETIPANDLDRWTRWGRSISQSTCG